MIDATREALTKVGQILHEAGWDQPLTQPIPPADLARIRHAYETLLRQDHSEILTAVLRNGLTVEKAGENVGLSADDATRLFNEALRRLSDFVDQYDGDPSRMIGEPAAGITPHFSQKP
jgi:hypothetical protein